jgi:apolipoprotein N-acyltransferase
VRRAAEHSPAEPRRLRFAPYTIALLAGAASVPAFSPWGLAPLAIVALAVLMQLWLAHDTPRAAAWLGFCFGLGLFGGGVSWVYVSMHRFGGMPMPLAALATALLCAYLALFPALTGWLQAKLRASPALRATLVVPALWTVSEWLRGWLFTGLPWLTLGTAFASGPLAGYAPLVGAHGVSFVASACAGLLWTIARARRRWLAVAALALVLAAGAALRSVEWSVPAGAPFQASLLQGNVPQDLKFDPARYALTLETYARLAEGSSAKLIVLPETAVPRFLDRVDPAYLARLEAAAKRNGGDLLLGIPYRSSSDDYYNSVVSLGVSPRQIYSKIHLVPFGEFVPPGLGWLVRAMAVPLSDFSRGAADQHTLAVAGQRVAPNICYEDIFAAETARDLPAATLLVNLSNVAWFGDSLAPGQHLQIARLRAIETGRMHLTTTNTGVTAAIGRDGQVLARLPQFVEGRLDVEVQGYTGVTPYARWHDWPALVAALVVLAAVALRMRRR